ncbi:MAG TPA: protein kinase [Vicinamibacterales bacterium]|nr:protein kinase [Vicinamibacterales bacterium]
MSPGIPSVISHYRLRAPIGEGGMAVVYQAEDLRLGRDVAIKLLRLDAIGAEHWLARFEREARLASALKHPHICTIHELGEHDGQPFIVMERLEGVTVRQCLQSGPMPPERVLELARQIADALDAAHRRGIVHRDIKPANLFVTDGDQIKILDFGVAKLARGEGPPTGTVSLEPLGQPEAAADLTRTGAAVGTVAYMSPEQARGLPADARSDLFSLGSVLYEMSTGQRAFGGDDAARILGRIVNGAYLPPRSVNPAIPEALDAIIRRLITVDPEQRYQTAADLLVDIDAALRAPGCQRDPSNGTSAAVYGLTRRRRVAVWLGAVTAVATTGVAASVWLLQRAAPLAERDSIVIGSMENNTGDADFDGVLVTAVNVQLSQSPFLDIVPERRLGETLRLMGRTADERLTHALAREVCQRLGVKAMVDGSLAALGRNYVLLLNATDCLTGQVIARAQAEATTKPSVLTALGGLSKRIRTTLGESLPTIQKFDVPIEQATTPSLAALKAYTLGLEERRRGRELESIAFFNQAIELDRQFASAYGTLSTVYGGLGEWRRSEDSARHAYELRGRVSERERLFIEYQYHDRVTGNADRAAGALQLWKAAYPRDWRPANALALAHNRTGQYARAEAEAREALRRSPGQAFALSNLAFAYQSMGRYADARRVADEAVALGVETSPTRRLLYHLAVLAGDGSAETHVAWSKDRPREFDIVSARAEVAGYEGRVREASDLYRRAADIATARGLKGTASGYLAHIAWMEALYGERRHAADRVSRIIAAAEDIESRATIPRFRAAAALGLVGLVAEAQALVRRAEHRYPEATFLRTVLSPTTRAAIALQQGRADAAIDALGAAIPTEFGTIAGLVPGYLRGEAYLQKGLLTEAIAEYTKVLEHRGVSPFAPVIPMARLGIARAHARAGDAASSRRAYDELFAIWKHADAGFVPLAAARGEYAALSSRPD